LQNAMSLIQLKRGKKAKVRGWVVEIRTKQEQEKSDGSCKPNSVLFTSPLPWA